VLAISIEEKLLNIRFKRQIKFIKDKCQLLIKRLKHGSSLRISYMVCMQPYASTPHVMALCLTQNCILTRYISYARSLSLIRVVSFISFVRKLFVAEINKIQTACLPTCKFQE
jgi:hypothetical protein